MRIIPSRDISFHVSKIGDEVEGEIVDHEVALAVDNSEHIIDFSRSVGQIKRYPQFIVRQSGPFDLLCSSFTMWDFARRCFTP